VYHLFTRDLTDFLMHTAETTETGQGTFALSGFLRACNIRGCRRQDVLETFVVPLFIVRPHL